MTLKSPFQPKTFCDLHRTHGIANKPCGHQLHPIPGPTTANYNSFSQRAFSETTYLHDSTES